MQHDDRSVRPVVGIDVAKQRLDVFVDLPAAARHFSFANDDAGRVALVAELRRLDAALVCIEATGRYHRRLAADLLDAGIPVAVVNPQRVREFARATGRLEKTDPIDARVLAEFARAVGPRRQEQQPPQKQTELRDLVSRRRALVQVRVAEKNRLADAEDAPKLARSQAAKLLRVVEQQIEDLDRAIARLVERDDDWNNRAGIIASVKGIGQATANQLVADLPELGKLDRQQIAKLAGVAPLNCDSGTRRGQRHIRGGRHDVRLTPYMGAFNAILHNPRFKAFAGRLKDAGKPFKVIVTAAMRKLLVILNQMVKTNTPWNPDLAFKFD
jgi:transposase